MEISLPSSDPGPPQVRPHLEDKAIHVPLFQGCLGSHSGPFSNIDAILPSCEASLLVRQHGLLT